MCNSRIFPLSRMSHQLYLSAAVKSRWILCCKQHEPRMSFDDFLCFRNEQLPVVVQKLKRKDVWSLPWISSYRILITRNVTSNDVLPCWELPAHQWAPSSVRPEWSSILFSLPLPGPLRHKTEPTFIHSSCFFLGNRNALTQTRNNHPVIVGECMTIPSWNTSFPVSSAA